MQKVTKLQLGQVFDRPSSPGQIGHIRTVLSTLAARLCDIKLALMTSQNGETWTISGRPTNVGSNGVAVVTQLEKAAHKKCKFELLGALPAVPMRHYLSITCPMETAQLTSDAFLADRHIFGLPQKLPVYPAGEIKFTCVDAAQGNGVGRVVLQHSRDSHRWVTAPGYGLDTPGGLLTRQRDLVDGDTLTAEITPGALLPWVRWAYYPEHTLGVPRYDVKLNLWSMD